VHIERKKDLSIYYWLVDLFSDATYVVINDGYPETGLEIPTVVVDWHNIKPLPYEMGNSNQMFHRLWAIDVYAINKSQRDDFGYRIIGALQNSIPVYDYDEGFPSDVSPTQLGNLLPENLQLIPIKIMPELVTKLYYRATVTFVAKYSLI
jgi:hypothetical protein